MDRDNNTTFSTDDGESIEGYDSVLESPPFNKQENPSEGAGLPEFAELADFVEPAESPDVSASENLDSRTNFDPAVETGCQTRFCAHCSRFRRESLVGDRSGKRDVGSGRWLMFRRSLLLRKRKTVQAQCPACEFRTAKRVAQARRIDRVKKFFSKISGRESKACTRE